VADRLGYLRRDRPERLELNVGGARGGCQIAHDGFCSLHWASQVVIDSLSWAPRDRFASIDPTRLGPQWSIENSGDEPVRILWLHLRAINCGKARRELRRSKFGKDAGTLVVSRWVRAQRRCRSGRQEEMQAAPVSVLSGFS